MKIVFFSAFILITYFQSFCYANEELPIDTKIKILIYETIRDHNLNNLKNVEAISNNCLSWTEQEALRLAIETQTQLLLEINNNLLLPLLDRSIPSNYAMNEMKKLAENSRISGRIVDFMNNATNAGFSPEGVLEYIKEKIIKHKKKDTLK